MSSPALVPTPSPARRTLRNKVSELHTRPAPSTSLELEYNKRLMVVSGRANPELAHRIASLADREPGAALAAPAGALEYLRRLYYDTGLSNHAPGLAATCEITDLDHVVFGTDWPYAALPAGGGDPAPGLDVLGERGRAAVEAGNIGALVPRLVGAPA